MSSVFRFVAEVILGRSTDKTIRDRSSGLCGVQGTRPPFSSFPPSYFALTALMRSGLLSPHVSLTVNFWVCPWLSQRGTRECPHPSTGHALKFKALCRQICAYGMVLASFRALVINCQCSPKWTISNTVGYSMYLRQFQFCGVKVWALHAFRSRQ